MEGTSGPFCSSASTHYYPSALQFSKAIYIFACVVSVIISVSSTFENIVILLALRRCQSLHSPSKALLCSLALTDLFVGLVVLPLFAAYYMMIILEIPRYYCVVAIIYGRASTFIGAVSFETIATIAVDRYLALRLRLRYRQVVKLGRVIFILVLEWIIAAILAGSWFLNLSINMFSGTIALYINCLIISLCYISIYRGIRLHLAQVHQQRNSTERTIDFNVAQYRKTVNNSLWILGPFLLCYTPSLLSSLVVVATGLNDSTRFALQFGAITVYFNSTLNPILYCWRIKELKDKVIALLRAVYNFQTHDAQ